MVKIAFFLLLAIILITFLRSVIGLIARAFGGALQTGPAKKPGGPPTVDSGGELRKDPVCGTYVSTNTTFRKNARGEVQYFCSQTCLDKFKS